MRYQRATSPRSTRYLAVLVLGTLVAACGPDATNVSTSEPTAADATMPPATTTSTVMTQAPPPAFAGLTVAAVGDWYADDVDEGRHVQDAEQTRDSIIAAAPSLLLGLGDFSYEGDSPAGFFEFIAPLEAVMPIYPTYGNHDGIVEGELTRPGFYRKLREHFAVGAEWYSFDKGPIHFISINSEYPEGAEGFGRQFMELSEDLADAFANDEVKVILPFFHRAMVNPISSDGPDRTLQETIHPLLDRYSSKIPLALQAHHHIYIRTHAIAYSDERNADRCRDTSRGALCEAVHRIVDSGVGSSPTVYGPDGIVFVTVGTGGSYATGLTPDAPFVAVRVKPTSSIGTDPTAGTFGYLHLAIDQDLESIEGEYRANNGQVLDWFVIELP